MRISRKVEAMGVSLGFLLLGLGAVVAAIELLDLDQGEILLTVFVLPALVYVLLSGQLTELKVGPVAAKMAEPVGHTVFERVAENVDSVTAQVQDVLKGSPDARQQIVANMSRGVPPILHLRLGERYKSSHVTQYLDDLRVFRGFRFVVFVDADSDFVAYAPQEVVRLLLSLPGRADALLAAIEAGDEDALLRNPAVITDTIDPTASKRAALKLMLEHRLDAVLVVANGKVRGEVERAALVGELTLELTGR